jgi:glutaredoxin 3
MDSSNPNHAYLIQQINSTPVLVYSWVHCPYCVRAKETLKKMGITAVIYDLDTMPNGDQIMTHLFELTGQETVPNIFIGGKHVGGNSDLQSGLSNGSVQAKLREANVPFN